MSLTKMDSGLLGAAKGGISGMLGDQWLEVLEADDMDEHVVFCQGVKVRRNDSRNVNKKGTENIITDGSIVHVYDNQFMMIVDGGKIVDYSAEPGYYTVKMDNSPSMFNGQFKDSIKESFNRIKFAGTPSRSQKVFYINLQEIKGIKFGTPNPLNYFDSFYNSELFLRTYGNYSIKIVDPIRFYMEAVPRSANRITIDEINAQYLSEFLMALQTAINQMSVDGIRISHVPSQGMTLSKYMSNVLDEEWRELRGMEVCSVGLANISYDDESKELIKMRNQGAMLGDPTIREGYVQGSVARGIESAGSNESGAMNGFMGVGMGLMGAGNFMGAASQSNTQQMNQQGYQQQGYQQAPPQGYYPQPNSGPAQQYPQQPAQNGYYAQSQQGGHDTSQTTAQGGMPQQNGGSGVEAAQNGADAPAKVGPNFCPECGTPNPGGKFCMNCGHKF